MSDAPWIPPADVKTFCGLCPEELQGLEATVDHLRLMHPDQYEEPTRWPDGGIVFEAGPEIL